MSSQQLHKFVFVCIISEHRILPYKIHNPKILPYAHVAIISAGFLLVGILNRFCYEIELLYVGEIFAENIGELKNCGNSAEDENDKPAKGNSDEFFDDDADKREEQRSGEGAEISKL